MSSTSSSTSSSTTSEHHEDTGMIPDDPLTGHSYDGIQEFDNPLPGWWKWLFIATILFSPPYFMFFHGGAEGRTMNDRYDRAMAANLRLQFAEIGELQPNRETVVEFLYKSNWLQVGKTVYKANCVSCHGSDGGGRIGPNLCDDHYKNVKDIKDILTVLQNGANAGAMPAWKTRMTENELILTASYVASLRGTEPAEPKATEGRIIDPWPEAPPEEVEGEAVEGETGQDEANGTQQPASTEKAGQ